MTHRKHRQRLVERAIELDEPVLLLVRHYPRSDAAPTAVPEELEVTLDVI
jgi:hypothetical protein